MVLDEDHDDGGEGMGASLPTLIITRLINHDDDTMMSMIQMMVIILLNHKLPDQEDKYKLQIQIQIHLHDQEHGGQIPRKAGLGGPHAQKVDVSI